MKKARKQPYATASNLYLFLMLLYVLWFDAAGLTAISAAKRTAFYTISALYLLALLLIFTYDLLNGKHRLSDCIAFFRRSSLTQCCIGLYLLFTIISALASPYRQGVFFGATRYEGVLTISLYCIGFFFVSRFARPKKWMLWVLSAVLIVFCTIGFLQKAGFDPLSLYPSFGKMKEYSHSFLSTIGNIDLISAFLCIIIPTLWVFILRFSGKQKYLLLIPLAFCLAMLFLIRVAGGLCGIALGALVTIPIVIPAGKKVRRIVGCLSAALFLLVILLLYFVDFGNTTLHELHEVLNGRILDHFGTGRIFIWKQVLKQIPQRIFFGYGPDAMSFVRLPVKQYFNANNELIRVTKFDTAHNEYLNILFHQGIFALLSYFGALVTALIKWLRSARENVLAAAFGAAVLAYAIQAFFGISQLISAPFFWCALALLDGSTNQCEKNHR